MSKASPANAKTAPFGEETIDLERLGQSAQLIHEVAETGEAKVVTHQGVPVAAIVDASTYESLRAQQLLRDLQIAAAEVDAGRFVEHEAVMQELRDRFKGRIPDSQLRALDGA